MSARIPDEEHALKGTRPTRARPEEPSKFAAGRPKMPRDLPEVAQIEWKRLVKELQRRGTLTRCDSSALEIYCLTYARYKAVVAEANSRPVIATTWTDKNEIVHTKTVENPASKIAGRLENSLRAMLKEFSATPASREKAKPAAEPKTTKKFAPGSIGAILAEEEDEKEE